MVIDVKYQLYISLLLLVLLLSPFGHSQMQATFTTEANTICDGSGCDWDGPSILINELMISPTVFDGSLWEPNCVQSLQTRCGEWIELYNPNICEPVDISCYFLGNNSPDNVGNQPGGYTFPPGTIIPPAGFLVLRGEYAPDVDPSLLVQNGGKTVEITIQGENSCIGNGNRLWFPNAGGWFAFYDADGVPQDAISWGTQANIGLSPCNPLVTGCSYTGGLASYNQIPIDRKAKVFDTFPNSWGQSVRRIPDGGPWATFQGGAPTLGGCNSECAEVGESTCDGTATINVTGGNAPYNFVWNDSEMQMTQTATGLCAGIYQVTVIDANGVSQVFSVEVEDLELELSVSFEEDFCGLGNGEITIDNVDGSIAQPYTYSIDGGNSFQSDNYFSNLSDGTYDIVVQDTNTCIGIEEVVISEFDGLPYEITAVNPLCFSDCNGDIEIEIDGGNPPFVYSWTDADGNVIGNTNRIEDLCAGTYYFTFTDGNDCSIEEEITLVDPSEISYNIVGVNPTCGNTDGSITLSSLEANTDYYLSYNFDGILIPVQVITADAAGEYEIANIGAGAYTDFSLIIVDGCPLSNDQEINLVEPGPPILIAPKDTSVCTNGEFELVAFNPDNAELTWSGGIVDGESFVITETGVYTYVVTAVQDNCTSVDSTVITVLQSPEAIFQGENLYGCKPLTSVFTGETDGVECSWDFGDNTTVEGCGTQSHTYTYSGFFTVKFNVRGENGCETTVTKVDYVEVTPNPVAGFVANPEIGSVLDTEVEFINHSEYANEYTWIFGDDSPYSHEVHPSHLYPEDIISFYYVTLIATNGEGCVDTVVKVIEIRDELIFYVPNAFTPDGDEFNDVFSPVFYSGFDPQDYNLKIYNRWGEILFESNDAQVGWDGTYNGKIVLDGTYVWKIEFLETMTDQRHTYTGHVSLLR